MLLLISRAKLIADYLLLCTKKFSRSIRHQELTTQCGLSPSKFQMKFLEFLSTKEVGNSQLVLKSPQVVKSVQTNTSWMTTPTAVSLVSKSARVVNLISLTLRNARPGTHLDLNSVTKTHKDSKFLSSSVNSVLALLKVLALKKSNKSLIMPTNTSLDGLTGSSNSLKIWQLQQSLELKVSMRKMETSKDGKSRL